MWLRAGDDHLRRQAADQDLRIAAGNDDLVAANAAVDNHRFGQTVSTSTARLQVDRNLGDSSSGKIADGDDRALHVLEFDGLNVIDVDGLEVLEKKSEAVWTSVSTSVESHSR